MLRRSAWLVIVAVGLCLAAAVVVSVVAKREYRATAVVRVTTAQGQEIHAKQVSNMDIRGFQETERFYRTQVQLFKSRSFADRLAADYEGLTGETVDPRTLGGRLEVFPIERSQLMEVSFVDTDPQRAADLAQLSAVRFVRENLEWRQQMALDANAWVNDRIGELEERRQSALADLLAFKARENLIERDELDGPLWSRLDALEEQYGRVSAERVLLQSKVDSHERLLGSGDLHALVAMEDLSLTKDLRAAFASAKADLASASGRLGPRHPEYVRARTSLERLTDQVRRDVKASLNAERAALNTLRDQETRLFQERSQTKDEALELQRVQREYEEMKRQLAQIDETHKSLLKRRDELELSGRTRLNNAQLVDAAKTPEGFIRPRISLILAAGLALGLLIGLGLALLRGLLDETVLSPADIDAFIKRPLLGVLPRTQDDPAVPRELVTHLQPRTALAEAIRGVRTMVANRPDGRQPRRILITSSVASEGKTSIAVGIAIAYAQHGKRVCLVEGDLRRPRLHRVFGHEDHDGIADVLADPSRTATAPQPTVVPGLDVLSRGHNTAGSVERLTSDQLSVVLDHLDASYDLVILDTPPSAALSDAVTMSRMVDSVIVVVRVGKVSRSLVRHTVRRIEQVGAEVAGIVVNDFEHRGADKYGQYYYDAAYRYTADAEDRAAK